MTDQERLLSTALRDLCGWHVGMVTDYGHVVVDEQQTSEITAGCAWGCAPACGHTDLSEYDLPDLDSPANWGHWLAWMSRNNDGESGAQLQLYDGGCVARVWNVAGACSLSFGKTAARALLSAFVGAMPRDSLPPSVLAWWEHEQGEGSDG